MDTLKPLIDELVAMVKSGKDVLSGNLPQVMKQIIAYEIWYCWFWIKVCCGAIVLSGICFFMDYRTAIRINNDPHILYVYDHAGIVPAIFVAVIGIFFLCVNYVCLKKIRMAPKVYMLDKLHEYLKSE